MFVKLCVCYPVNMCLYNSICVQITVLFEPVCVHVCDLTYTYVPVCLYNCVCNSMDVGKSLCMVFGIVCVCECMRVCVCVC